MSEPVDERVTAPVTGFSHVQLNVVDVARSEAWYVAALGLERLTAADDGSYVALRHPTARTVVVLTAGLVGDATAGALDHLAFGVADGATLLAWADALPGRGVAHPGVVDELGKPSLTLTDPDGNRIELVAPPGSWPDGSRSG